MQLFETNYRTISKEDSGQSNVIGAIGSSVIVGFKGPIGKWK